ncbi:L-threonylcarbamoyladenylate synthase [Ferrovum sp.]|uniref:L-threonylcarbamoyladenylate synthase n=1 Tax=Ferrovum sp. TaxID=2609467 RepID=UPI002638F0E2|nr:L-threonylcarbamoyladenylate synthase [Ferrovum sp.]
MRGLRTFLGKGGLVAYPTRAVYGLGCDPGNHLALRALLRLKSRPIHKGLIVVADRRDLLRRFHVPLSVDEEARLQARWPGGHTWLIPARRPLTTWLRGRKRGFEGDLRPRIALRQDDYEPLARLCRRLDMALVSTSANRSGRKPLKTARACRQAFGSRVRVIDGRCQANARPSTVADLITGRVIRV